MNDFLKTHSQFTPLSEEALATREFFPLAAEAALSQFEALGATSPKEPQEQGCHQEPSDCIAQTGNLAPSTMPLDVEHLNIQLDLALKNLEILQSQMDLLHLSHAKQLAQISENTNSQEAKLLLEALQGLSEKIESRIAAETARILEPFISAQLKSKILDRFKQTVAECLSNEDAIKVSVHGPQNLIAALAELQCAEGQLKLVVDEGNAELVATFNDQTIATCFASWAAMLGSNAQ